MRNIQNIINNTLSVEDVDKYFDEFIIPTAYKTGFLAPAMFAIDGLNTSTKKYVLPIPKALSIMPGLYETYNTHYRALCSLCSVICDLRSVSSRYKGVATMVPDFEELFVCTLHDARFNDLGAEAVAKIRAAKFTEEELEEDLWKDDEYPTLDIVKPMEFSCEDVLRELNSLVAYHARELLKVIEPQTTAWNQYCYRLLELLSKER